MMQNAKQASRRPNLSARMPVKDAVTAAAMKPVMNSAATTSSGSCFVSVRG